jgi:catechol 2,3-dioxygenase-like lactoylglutathione lyase family enzyme
MLSVGTVVLRVTDMDRAVDFWTRALGYRPRDGETGEEWTTLLPPGGDGVGISLDRTDEPPPAYPHVHLDLYAGDAADQAAEVERLVGLGAERVDWDRYPDDPDFIVLADPAGNRFCVIDTSHP